ncbi:ORF6N domain-containing protein [bacterium AH-315-I20]|nr:ORF6N domain-containing protein [bacterium AH-315-I20]
MDIVRLENIEDKLITVQGEKVLLDSDVGEIYGVETKRINEAVKNNPDKFPVGYILDLSDESWESLRSKISTLNGLGRGVHRKYKPKVFTERGLYMLATILKGELAVSTTLAIVDTFYKIRHLSKNINALTSVKDEKEQKALMQKSGEIIAEVLDNGIETTDTETTIELNFA